MQKIKIVAAGDSSILIEFGREINEEINRKITTTVQLIHAQQIEGVVDMIPAFCTLLINYDPRIVSFEKMRKRIQELVKMEVKAGTGRKKVFEIPVCYGGEYGPDIDNIASHAGLTKEEVIQIHSSRVTTTESSSLRDAQRTVMESAVPRQESILWTPLAGGS